MKKIITAVIMGTMFTLSSFAELALGVRGSVGASIMSISESEERGLGTMFASIVSEADGNQPATYSVENTASATGGFSFFANYSFPSIPALGIQGELGLLFGNGTEITVESKTSNITADATIAASYTTLEIPFLVTYTFNKGNFFEFIPQAGLYLSVPVGKLKYDTEMSMKVSGTKISDDDSDEGKIDNVTFGTCLGADFALNFSEKSAMLFNLRYLFDFNELQSEDEDFARRTAFLFGIAYRHTLR